MSSRTLYKIKKEVMNDNFHKMSMDDKHVFQYEDTPNDNESDSPDSSRNDGNQFEHKSKKKYSVIPQNIREKFISRVLSKEVTIKEVIISHFSLANCLGC